VRSSSRMVADGERRPIRRAGSRWRVSQFPDNVLTFVAERAAKRSSIPYVSQVPSPRSSGVQWHTSANIQGLFSITRDSQNRIDNYRVSAVLSTYRTLEAAAGS